MTMTEIVMWLVLIFGCYAVGHVLAQLDNEVHDLRTLLNQRLHLEEQNAHCDFHGKVCTRRAVMEHGGRRYCQVHMPKPRGVNPPVWK